MKYITEKCAYCFSFSLLCFITFGLEDNGNKTEGSFRMIDTYRVSIVNDSLGHLEGFYWYYR